ncbi:MAG: hypothetical protein HZA54_06485 [Planctomycetes bacterium]|nr:hypothetical protein [Planctomycetota bacterium]
MANDRAQGEYLRSLTQEESLAVFMELCEGIPELRSYRPPKPPPVVLFRLWRS